jgi:FAD:protein FMN transferase
MNRDRWIGAALMAGLAALVSVGLWKTRGGMPTVRQPVVREVSRLMGTTATVAAVVPPGHSVEVDPVLRETEQTLRRLEGRLSTWLTDSETGKLNAAAAGQHVPLSPEVLDLLRTAQQAAIDTDGVFDVTCRPLVELWREAGRRDALPTEQELAAARAESNWDLIELDDTGAVKQRDTARIDLGGIAKGYAIDRALAVLKRDGRLEGGLVDVGGDLACFGRPPSGEQWPVEVRDPFGPDVLFRLRLSGGAVCSSGDYARFVEMKGKRYSHIIDPRTGRPAGTVHAVTVVAPTAVVADVWATALSVLGVEGFSRLPPVVEALIVEGDATAPRLRCTPGFPGLLEAEPPAPLEVACPPGSG